MSQAGSSDEAPPQPAVALIQMLLAMMIATPLCPPEWANRCGCAGSHGSCSHDPAAPTPDNGLGGCGECEPHSDATPTPNADVVMSDACSSSVEMSPEAALQGGSWAHSALATILRRDSAPSRPMAGMLSTSSS